jgi:FtsP/CotA-like multicopper oxidase with cupredoxin domain
MRGLVLGLHVLPKPGRAEAVRERPREIRLLVQSRPNRLVGGHAAVGFAVQRGDTAPARDSVVIPGPVLELRRGQPVRITVVNTLAQATGVHWHGLEIESFPDGVPGWSGTPGRIMPPIAPRDSFVAEFTPSRAGTFLYHSHMHELAQISAGMYGALVVVDSARDPKRDHLVVVGGGGLPVYAKTASPYAYVNGRRSPRPLQLTAGETHRLRLVSIHPEWAAQFRLMDDSSVVRWRAVAKDGADLPPALAVQQLARVELGPGETADFEVTPRVPGRWRMEVVGAPNGWFIPLDVIVTAPAKK